MKKKATTKFVLPNRVLFFSLGIIFVILIYLGISLYIAGQIVAPHRSQINVSPTLVSSDYENVTMLGTDQIPLKGWLFHAPSNKLIIFIHGIKQNRTNEGYYSKRKTECQIW